MRILVTGSTGKLGRLIFQELKSQGESVVPAGRGLEVEYSLNNGLKDEHDEYDLIIHCAFDWKNLECTPTNLNITGISALLPVLSKSGTVFVLSSDSAVYLTKYGDFKYYSEWHFRNSPQIKFVRVGLVSDNSTTGLFTLIERFSKVSHFALELGYEVKFNLTTIPNICKLALSSQVESPSISHPQQLISNKSLSEIIRMRNSKLRFTVFLPAKIMLILLQSLKHFSNRFDRLADSLRIYTAGTRE